jgi:AcrR family transcriptional regulator
MIRTESQSAMLTTEQVANVWHRTQSVEENCDKILHAAEGATLMIEPVVDMSQSFSVEKTREKILRVAGVLFGLKGFSGTNVRDIATKTDLTPASLYNHFENKEDLYRAVLSGGVKPLIDRLGGLVASENMDEALPDLIEDVMEHLAEHAYLPRLIFIEVATGGERLEELVREWLKPLGHLGNNAFKVSWIASDGQSAFSLEEAPLSTLAWIRLVFTHFALAPIMKIVLGRDPLSKECLLEQTQLLLKLARGVRFRGWNPEVFLSSQDILARFDHLRAEDSELEGTMSTVETVADTRKPKLVENTRDRILNEAAVLFAAQGFAGTSVRDIATQAGLTPASLYNHFANKENVYREALSLSLGAALRLHGQLATRMDDYEALCEVVIGTMVDLADRAHLPCLLSLEVATGAEVLTEMAREWSKPLLEQEERELRTVGVPLEKVALSAEEAPLIIMMVMQLVFGHFSMAPLIRIAVGRDPLSKQLLAEHTAVTLKLVRMMLSPGPG